MSWEEIKDEKEGYVRVRKSDDRALIGRLRKNNDDPEAKGYIELKVDDLGFEGGGGPHTHNNYALTGHTHDDYLTELPDHTHPVADHSHPEYEHGHEGGGQGYDDTELLKRLEQDEVVIEDHEKRLKVDETETSKNRQKIDNIQNSINDINNNKLPGKADVDHTHDNLGGGADYDDSEVRDLIQGNADAIAEIQTKGYDDTELRGLIDDKAEVGHTHDDSNADDITALWVLANANEVKANANAEKNDEQDERLNALEAANGGGELISGTWNADGRTQEAGNFHTTGKLNADNFVSFNKTDANGNVQDLSLVLPGHILHLENQVDGEWAKWEIVANGGLEYGKYLLTTKALESSSDASLAHAQPYSITFFDPNAVDTHEHDEYQPKGDYATTDDLSTGLSGKSDTTHDHDGMVVSSTVNLIVRLTQAEFDALADKDPYTLYLVV
jgi:hypothetical protein